MGLPVVAVVATHGEDRLHLLTERALPSIAKQTRKADLVVVVSDNDPLKDPLEEVDITEFFDADYRKHVRFIPNARTSGNSGTGPWNTGIMAALAAFGEDCWVAVLDDDDEWLENHLQLCLEAAARENCQWIVSGLIRDSPSGRKKENLLASEPSASDFFSTNPGVQGSNLFVRVRALLGAGLFDEGLSSTTDRDLCIRLCDLLSGAEDWFASTGEHTVVHYADADRPRVSSRGSPAKINGLKLFYLKYAPRMSDSQRQAFKDRAANLFDCPQEEFCSVRSELRKEEQLETWNGDRLPLNVGTLAMLPTLKTNLSFSEKRLVLFGVISSDLRRICPLLDDLSAASKSKACNYSPFVVVFANCAGAKFPELLQNEISKRQLRGHVVSRSSSSVESIILQCKDVELPLADERLPISVARTIVQVFIYNMPELESVGAVVIIDDDKRLPRGWSPLTATGTDKGGPDVLIGRDLRTPPNPSIFSLRTNLIDLLYSLDLASVDGSDKDEVKRYCVAQDSLKDKFDWYYDLSSSRTDHLEMPVHCGNVDFVGEDFAQVLNGFLVGTPLCRDVLPLESGPTMQRGGCMVIVNRGAKSFDPLAVQQHAPFVTFSDGTTSSTRRSDSFWCKEMNNRGLSVAVDEQMFVYHDNRFDGISSPQSIRKNVVQEVFGGILCRGPKWRHKYKVTRLLEMRNWLLRVRGILTSLRNRAYCTSDMIQSLIEPLEELLDGEKWEDEVFAVIESTFDSLREYQPRPADFSTPTQIGIPSFVKMGAAEMQAIKKELNGDRVEKAREVLQHAIGEQDAVYVGIGSEGVSFRVKAIVYKVFDRAHSKLPSKTTKLLNASYLNRPDLLPILKRPYCEGTLYRGGRGDALVRMLREWKTRNLYHTNLSPDNLIYNEKENTLMAIDIGRDVKYQPSDYLYYECFRGMCKRAYLCFRFGDYASNVYALNQLKQWMRGDFASLHLAGFETFMRLVYESDEDAMLLLTEKLEEMGAVCGHVVLTKDDEEDDSVLKRMTGAINQKVAEGCTRIGVAIEDPFHQKSGSAINRRPLWFYRRHLRRFQHNDTFSLEEDTVALIDQSTFEEYIGFHIFVLDFGSIAQKRCDLPCHILIKSCPLDYQSILSDVRRSVHCLEASASFKSIVLIADVSKVDGFLRQYAPIDMDAYNAALKQIEEERLVDRILRFDGEDSPGVAELNRAWLGKDCNATHSSQGQHYASTFAGFELIKNIETYAESDLILQMDCDIIVHCESSDAGLQECIANFDDPKLVTFPVPILSSGSKGRSVKHLDGNGAPFRFEIRCSFVHLDRILSLLPLRIPATESSTDESCLKRGWWHVLDYNIQEHGLTSCRGSVGDGTRLFFVHPPNAFKRAGNIDQLSMVSDTLSSCSVADLQKKAAWKKQLNRVNLQTLGGWLQERHESVVVVVDLSNAAYGSAMRKFECLARIRERKMFHSCGVILLDNGSSNNEDIISALFAKGRSAFDRMQLSCVALRKLLPPNALHKAVRSMCANPNAVVFIWGGGDDLHDSVCLLPEPPVQFCLECGSYYDETCQCYSYMACEFDGMPYTPLPQIIPSDTGSVQLHNTTFFASETITEGKLDIEVAALVNCLENVKDAEDVCVRIHSECLTGDTFYSMKCDCGSQKWRFMRIMAEEEKASRSSVFVYLKGHEGRGAGLPNKIKAYQHLDQHPTKTHVEALLAVGCESDVRTYDAAVRFIKYKLQVKSIVLFTNNPKKIKAVRTYFGSNFKVRPMPAKPGRHNEKYFREKVRLHGHDGLL